MMNFPFLWVDAFTEKSLGGNPCAVLLDAVGLTTPQMQAIAKEMNLSETAFVFSSEKADFKARYFTPTVELAFAGHPTIATVHALKEMDRLHSKKQVTLELKAGIIPVELTQNKIIMSQLAPKFLRTYDPKMVLPIFNLQVDDLVEGAVIQTVSTGTAFLMIPLRSLSAVRKAKVIDVEGYERLEREGDFQFPHHFCMPGISQGPGTFARSLGLGPTPNEDPFTGSATGCMGAYLWHYGHLKTPKFIAEQGHDLGRPGQAEVEIIGSRENIETIRVGGSAVTLIRGTFSF